MNEAPSQPQSNPQPTPPSHTEPFDQWAIVEVYGHQRYAGRVTEQTIGGASFVRIDVPETDGLLAFTKLFGSSAIFSITPTTEAIARQAVRSFRVRPIDLVELGPVQRRLPMPGDEDDDDEDDDWHGRHARRV